MGARGVGYTDDYTVNDIQFWYNKNKKEYFIDALDSHLNDIQNKVIRHNFYTGGICGLKKLYRMKRLWELGYRPNNKEDLVEKINTVLEPCKISYEHYGINICLSDMCSPSRSNGKLGTIQTTKFEYVQMSPEIFFNNSTIKEILEFIGY